MPAGRGQIRLRLAADKLCFAVAGVRPIAGIVKQQTHPGFRTSFPKPFIGSTKIIIQLGEKKSIL
jgi:hypothetical protein